MKDLDKRIALVTGGNRGIGKAICEVFLEHKLKVCFTGRDEKKAEEVLQEFRAKFGEKNVVFRKLEVTDMKEFEKTMKFAKNHFGGQLDILVNNAGIFDEEEWKSMLDINLVGCINGIKLAEIYLGGPNGKGGTVINNSSILGLRACLYGPVYCASKFGLVGLTLVTGNEYNVNRTNVKVAAVCPDLVDTPMIEHEISMLDTPEWKDWSDKLKSSKLIDPREIANAVIKLLEDDATAELLVVSRSKGSYYFPMPKEDCILLDGII